MAFRFPPGPDKLPPEDGLTLEEEELLRKVAQKVVDRRMTVPAIIFLESVKPLSYIGSQVMVFLEVEGRVYPALPWQSDSRD